MASFSVSVREKRKEGSLRSEKEGGPVRNRQKFNGESTEGRREKGVLCMLTLEGGEGLKVLEQHAGCPKKKLAKRNEKY